MNFSDFQVTVMKLLFENTLLISDLMKTQVQKHKNKQSGSSNSSTNIQKLTAA